MNIIIRKPLSEEILEIKVLTEKAFKEPYLDNGLVTTPKELEDLKERFEAGAIGILAAYVDNKMIGAVRYEVREGNRLRIFRLAVLKKFRFNGVASALLLAAEAEAKKLNCQVVGLDCVLEKCLQPYYEKRGYRVVEIKENGNRHDVSM